MQPVISIIENTTQVYKDIKIDVSQWSNNPTFGYFLKELKSELQVNMIPIVIAVLFIKAKIETT